MRYVDFTVFFIFSLLFIISIAFGSATIGIQPSVVEVFLNNTQTTSTTIFKLWNEGNQDISVTMTQHDISEFTNFTTMTIELKKGQSRQSGYTEVPVVFKKTSGNKEAKGGFYVRPITGNAGGTVNLIQQIDAVVKIHQNETTGITINTNVGGGSSSGGSSGGGSSSGGGGTSLINKTNTTKTNTTIPKNITQNITTNDTIEQNYTVENITEQPKPQKDNTILYVVIGAIVIGLLLLGYLYFSRM